MTTQKAKIHNLDIAKAVDRAGWLKAKMSEMQAELDQIKEDLIEVGVTEADGAKYRITISATQRANLDMAAVREKLSPQFINVHTNYTWATSMRVVARKL